jgi:hypothetical protein
VSAWQAAVQVLRRHQRQLRGHALVARGLGHPQAVADGGALCPASAARSRRRGPALSTLWGAAAHTKGSARPRKVKPVCADRAMTSAAAVHSSMCSMCTRKSLARALPSLLLLRPKELLLWDQPRWGTQRGAS